MAESKYKFERLTPTDDVDLAVYEEAIDYVFQNPDIKKVAFPVHIVPEKVAFWLHIRKIIVAYAFCIFHLHIFNHQVEKMSQRLGNPF